MHYHDRLRKIEIKLNKHLILLDKWHQKAEHEEMKVRNLVREQLSVEQKIQH